MVAEISQEAAKAVEKAVASYPNHWRRGISAFYMIDRKTGANSGPSAGDVCHADLSYGERGRNKNVIVVNGHKSDWKDLNSDFLLWVTQGSPFSHGVLNRDQKKELLDHASVMDTEIIGTGGALWLCKALRHFVEDTWKPEIWSKLRNEGLDGLQAFIGSDILTAEGRPYNACTHVSLFGYASPAHLRATYDKVRELKRIDGGQAACLGNFNAKEWGSLAGKMVKKPDGWGGFVEVRRPGEAKDYAQLLKEIFEGDPNNVR